VKALARRAVTALPRERRGFFISETVLFDFMRAISDIVVEACYTYCSIQIKDVFS
jgi:hypothetical protein